MRIIAGLRRGHKFDGPKGSATRPTSDLVRESIFNIVGGSITGMIVVDLFAGTGALGLEALSRGAARAVFVERKSENVALIHRNIATLRFEDRSSVLAADAYRWARGFEPIDDEPMAVFLDPPYRHYEAHAPKVNQMLEHLARKLPAGSLIALEASCGLDDRILPELDCWDLRRYGRTQVAIRYLTDGVPSSTLDSNPSDPPGNRV